MYKKGDIVFISSLQSFWKGGFLNSEPAIVRQNQISSSVIVMVVRNFDGKYRLDSSYEIYAKQVELFCSAKDMSQKELRKINKLFTRIHNDTEKRYEEEIYENSRICTKKTTGKFADIMWKYDLKVNGFKYDTF